jgi:hypothetical protein
VPSRAGRFAAQTMSSGIGHLRPARMGRPNNAPDRGGAVLAISKGSRAFPVVLGGSVALVVFMWCLKTSWRVVSGRPRNDGGLLSPWLIAAAGGFRCVGHVWPRPTRMGRPGWSDVDGSSLNRLFHRRLGTVSKKTPRLTLRPPPTSRCSRRAARAHRADSGPVVCAARGGRTLDRHN